MGNSTIDSLRGEIRGDLYAAGTLFRMNQNIRVP
jgi:hypothetical protein